MLATWSTRPIRPTREAHKNLPVMFYAFWIMIAITALTVVVFLPHALFWGLRELFVKTNKETPDREPDN